MNTIKDIELKKLGRKIWVFGAGASAVQPYHVPTQENMLSHFFDRKFPGRRRRQDEINELKKSAREICLKILPGVDPASNRLILEEVFSSYELLISERRSSKAEKQEAENALETLRNTLRMSTYVLGRGDARKWKPHARHGVASPYAELLEKIFPENKPVSKDNTFVTFNYDICLDRCLINLREKLDIDLDYGLVLANGRSKQAPVFSNPRPGYGQLLLRTHGGLNWLRCDACESVFTTVNKHATVSEAQRCYSCNHERLNYIFVHPSYIRKYNDPIIKLVWGRSQEEFVLSDTWIFIGYSLPAADVHFRELLRHCLKRRDAEGKETKIIIIGRSKNGSFISDKLEHNYNSMFRGRITVWESTPNGFADLHNHVI